MKEMLCRCSLEDLAIWYIICTHELGSDNKNGFLKTGVNLNYLVFLFESVICSIDFTIKNTGYKCFFTAAVLGISNTTTHKYVKGR